MGLTIPEKGFNIVMRDKQKENEMSMSYAAAKKIFETQDYQPWALVADAKEVLLKRGFVEPEEIDQEESARLASAMAAVNELSKSMDLPTGRNYPAWNARKQEAAAKRRMNSKPEDR